MVMLFALKIHHTLWLGVMWCVVNGVGLSFDVFANNKNRIVKIALGNGQELIDADGYNLLYGKSLFHLDK